MIGSMPERSITPLIIVALLLGTWLALRSIESPSVTPAPVSSVTALAPGTRLVFESGAIVVIDGENEPCTKTGKALSAQLGRDVRAKFVKAAWHRRGLVAWVERPGVLNLGDEPRLVPR